MEGFIRDTEGWMQGDSRPPRTQKKQYKAPDSTNIARTLSTFVRRLDLPRLVWMKLRYILGKEAVNSGSEEICESNHHALRLMTPVATRFAVKVMMLEIKEAFSFPRFEDPVMPTRTSKSRSIMSIGSQALER